MWGGVLGDGQSAGYASASVHSPRQSGQSPGGVAWPGETWLALWVPGGRVARPAVTASLGWEFSANKAARVKA